MTTYNVPLDRVYEVAAQVVSPIPKSHRLEYESGINWNFYHVIGDDSIASLRLNHYRHDECWELLRMFHGRHSNKHTTKTVEGDWSKTPTDEFPYLEELLKPDNSTSSGFEYHGVGFALISKPTPIKEEVEKKKSIESSSNAVSEKCDESDSKEENARMKIELEEANALVVEPECKKRKL